MQERAEALPSLNGGVEWQGQTLGLDRNEIEKICKKFCTHLFAS